MSYCRFGEDSDVYMYYSGGIECCGCKLKKDGNEFPVFSNAREAIKHLIEHQEAGHKVPEYAFAVLKSEAEDDDNNNPEIQRLRSKIAELEAMTDKNAFDRYLVERIRDNPELATEYAKAQTDLSDYLKIIAKQKDRIAELEGIAEKLYTHLVLDCRSDLLSVQESIRNDIREYEKITQEVLK